MRNTHYQKDPIRIRERDEQQHHPYSGSTVHHSEAVDLKHHQFSLVPKFCFVIESYQRVDRNRAREIELVLNNQLSPCYDPYSIIVCSVYIIGSQYV